MLCLSIFYGNTQSDATIGCYREVSLDQEFHKLKFVEKKFTTNGAQSGMQIVYW